MTDQNSVFRWATKVQKVMMNHMERSWNYAYSEQSDMAYGEALAIWNEKGRPDGEYFSTEDPDMIALADEFTKEFGLEVVSREEGLRRAAPVTKVCGWVN